MKSLRILIVLVAASISISIFALGAKQEEAPWTLRIVPTRSSEKSGTTIDNATKASYFYVVLSNISKNNMSVWREWCSWGNECLSFDITIPNAKTFRVTKVPREYGKNWPDSFVVQPGNHFVYKVRFNDDWAGFPKDWKKQKVKIKAIYEVKKDDSTERLNVWTGKLESPEIETTLHTDY